MLKPHRILWSLVFLLWIASVDTLTAQSPFLRLLKSGRLPAERQGNVVKLVCDRGSAEDLAYIFEQTVAKDGFTPEVQLIALTGLLDAASTRKVVPDVEFSQLGQLIGKEQVSPEVQLAAIRLAGVLKVEAVAEQLEKLALSQEADAELRQAALNGLVGIGGDAAKETLLKLTTKERPQPIRYQGVAALTGFDLDQAAQLAAQVLAEGTDATDPAVLMAAFLDWKQGPDQLAAALKEQPPSEDVAKMCLRYMYSVGRSDPALVSVLSNAANISLNPKPLSKAEVAELAREIAAEGDPARGELIFRRESLSCTKCHAVSGAGGNIGPDLSGIGANSPIDYLINSIIAPNQAIKEQYATLIVFTLDGKVHQGIVVEKNDERLTLRTVKGKDVSIATEDIDEEVEGESLMPKGLANFLTHSEFVDLVSFLSVLGKPNTPYAIRGVPTIQRWRLLNPVPKALTAGIPDAATFEQQVLQAPEGNWEPAYGMVAGDLPLPELGAKVKGQVLYVQGEIEVTESGKVGIKANSLQGANVWIGDESFEAQNPIVTTLSSGKHPVTFRIDLAARGKEDLRVELFKPAGSSAEFQAVGGP